MGNTPSYSTLALHYYEVLCAPRGPESAPESTGPAEQPALGKGDLHEQTHHSHECTRRASSPQSGLTLLALSICSLLPEFSCLACLSMTHQAAVPLHPSTRRQLDLRHARPRFDHCAKLRKNGIPGEDPDLRRRDVFTTSAPRGLDPFPGTGFSSQAVF